MAREAMSKKQARKRRKVTPEHKAEVVRLFGQPGNAPHGMAAELGQTMSAVSNWGRAAMGVLDSDVR